MPPEEWLIYFHSRCGKSVRLLNGDRRARRDGDTYDNGLVFSNRPLHIGELFQLKIEEMESKWAGSLRIGITTENPNRPELRIARAITDLFTNDNDNYWILSGSHVYNGTKEKKLYQLNLHTLDVYDRVAVQVKSNGDLHFFQNGFDKGIAISNIPCDKQVYAVFDLYGRTKQVSWDYYGAPSLENLCKKVIRKNFMEDEIVDFLIPSQLKEFLTHEAV
eukprot:gene17422-19166_t